ncbi:MAG: hypothetical protein DRI57_28415 [Deltaproteobacteria bacterium]|nr:MAG: hypothetical protein DRI57_28415 [Deltaproteobacteria bacterium]
MAKFGEVLQKKIFSDAQIKKTGFFPVSPEKAAVQFFLSCTQERDCTEQYYLRQMVFFQAAVVVGWADENVTARVTNCDPVFIPSVFFNLKISQL